MSTLLQSNLQQLNKLKTDLFNKDFLLTWQQSEEEIRAVLLVAEMLKELHQEGRSFRVFNTGLAVSIFRDQSTRTRFSFASAVNALGLGLADFDEVKSQVAHGETVRETANMISFLTEVIGIRDDIYLGEGHKYMQEVGDAIQEGFSQGVLNRRPSLINLQCDIDHPTQSLADLLHLKQRFGSLENVHGQKIAVTWAYSPSYGKPLSVPQGFIGLLTRFGATISLTYPQGYDLLPEVIKIAYRNAETSGGQFELVGSMEEAFKDAVAVYPKSWAPFTVMQRRTELMRTGDRQEIEKLEKECLTQNAEHQDWVCDESKMKLTNGGNALYMHCLPADISGVSCMRGEVSQAVFEKYRFDTYRQASNKPFIIAAIILLTRFENAADKLVDIVKRRQD